MANRTLQSSQITFVDFTDSRTIDVRISSNLPTIQIKNSNITPISYQPDWTNTNLILRADVYVESQDVTSGANIKWYIKDADGVETEITSISNRIVSGNTLTITSNELVTKSFITFTCRATYQDIDGRTEQTFARIDTGANGKDGNSIAVKGTASSVSQVTGTNYYTITYGDGVIAAAELGDSYLYDGDLYVCSVLNGNGDKDYFINVGDIQGPAGEPGADAKYVIVTGNQIFKSTNGGVTYTPSSITLAATLYGGLNGYQWYKNGVAITNATNATLTISPSEISNTATYKCVSENDYYDAMTIVKVIDGIKGDAGDSAPLAFLTNENITFSADAQGRVSATTQTSNIVAYVGTTSVLPTVGEISGIPTGMTITQSTIVNEVILTISVEDESMLGAVSSTNGTITIPITIPTSPIISMNLILSWSKINTGASGDKGEDAVSFQIYSDNGYVLSKNLQSITLKTFAYKGGVLIGTGATYQWYESLNDSWQLISNETNDSLTVDHSDIANNKSYKCVITLDNALYSSVVTVEDKTDINVVYTSKPNSYSVGDLWVLGTDYAPNNYEAGTILRAEHTSDIYNDTDWVLATRYDSKIQDIVNDLDKYNNHFLFDTNGLLMYAVDDEGNRSPFTTTLGYNKLSFNQGSQEVAYISNNKLYITEAEVVSPLTVSGKYSGSTVLQAPTINIGKFSFIVESNGSLSIVSNS